MDGAVDLKPKFNIAFCRFTFDAREHIDVANWIIRAVDTAQHHPQVDKIFFWTQKGTPVSMMRNRCLREMEQQGVDYVFMVDDDMSPDIDKAAPKFFDTSFDFACAHQEETLIIAAPYCDGPPRETVHVFQWVNKETGSDQEDFNLINFGRQEAIRMSGITRVAGVATGLVMIDTRICDILKPPWFYYEYSDEYELHKTSTEDAVFTRNAGLVGASIYCNWDCWSGHWKPKRVGKPESFPLKHFGKNLRDALMDIYLGKAKSPAEDLTGSQPNIL